MQGHQGADCTAEGTARVPPQESRWRALCGRCLGRSRRDQATAVNHVAEAGEFVWAGYADDQGNGEGPPIQRTSRWPRESLCLAVVTRRTPIRTPPPLYLVQI
jgi:hypothetical protein